MIKIQRFTCNMLSENCYVASDESRECVIIDCGAFYSEESKAITSYIQREHLTPKHLICTHGHFDHCMGNGIIYDTYGLKPEIHVNDTFLMEKMSRQVEEMTGMHLPFNVPPVGKYLDENDVIKFGSHQLQIIHTPGHTPGGVVFYCEDGHVAFSGDTLFRMSIGRTDFERGSFEEICQSLKKLAQTLPSDTVVYPGHGPQTVLAEEISYNPYMR